ncbi:hypothetical protein [Streptomyces arenae]|uniref:hypothetical protein n=1 Tax=Streptomyces arenae TaxID=29301 RepID=UPI0026580506|nr:hypothetical protein [Streptomyces arenae]MCG7202875.1 hypothetical protein [Streptomyces arenae]
MLQWFPVELRTEICALSFHIWRVENDKRRPYVAIGHDIKRQYEAERRLADPGEARWYSAC